MTGAGAGRLIFASVGIYVCYLSYGVLQERIYKEGPADDRFRYTSFLMVVQVLVNLLSAILGIVMLPHRDTLKTLRGEELNSAVGRRVRNDAGVQGTISAVQPEANVVVVRFDNGTTSTVGPDALRTLSIPATEFAVIGFAFVAAMLASNESLNGHVSYPMQALAKSCKMIPVMLMGVLIRGKRYHWKEYACVALITGGIIAFRAFKPGDSKSGPENTLYGMFLLLLSLFFDGVTGPKQEVAMQRYNPSMHQLMLHTNIWGLVFSVVAVVVTGEMFEGVAYCARNPAALLNILLFSVASAAGQNFIFMTLHGFNALVLATVTTTRKFFTILLSVIIFKNALAPKQWASVAMVFAGLIWDVSMKAGKKKGGHKHGAPAPSKKTQ